MVEGGGGRTTVSRERAAEGDVINYSCATQSEGEQKLGNGNLPKFLHPIWRIAPVQEALFVLMPIADPWGSG